MTSSTGWRYRIVDVFTSEPLQGNALAVFPDASGIPEQHMQAIAREFNLSETVFVLPATDRKLAARLRIFTPGRELPFAGHPTVGTSYVLLDEGMVPRATEHFVLEEKIGPVPIRVEAGEAPLIWLTSPPLSFGRIVDRGACARALGVSDADLHEATPQIVSAGNPGIFVALKSKEAVDRCAVDLSGLNALSEPGDDAFMIFVFAPTAEGAYSRMFAPEIGVMEDPATGSATPPLAAYMRKNQLVPKSSPDRFVSEQGTKMGRRSLLHVKISGDQIEVGGQTTPVMDGTLNL
ncbi:MAG: PhzF family phenazine biosynthesis protein [Acidobacteriales bacterium]|nr:PhzF family phenazine biosynthesis protein [Terriglobales bacterium]